MRGLITTGAENGYLSPHFLGHYYPRPRSRRGSDVVATEKRATDRKHCDVASPDASGARHERGTSRIGDRAGVRQLRQTAAAWCVRRYTQI